MLIHFLIFARISARVCVWLTFSRRWFQRANVLHIEQNWFYTALYQWAIDKKRNEKRKKERERKKKKRRNKRVLSVVFFFFLISIFDLWNTISFRRNPPALVLFDTICPSTTESVSEQTTGPFALYVPLPPRLVIVELDAWLHTSARASASRPVLRLITDYWLSRETGWLWLVAQEPVLAPIRCFGNWFNADWLLGNRFRADWSLGKQV